MSPRPARPDQPEPFLRGCPFAAAAGVPYPRADGRDFTRLPVDTWGTAQIPATVRLELVGEAEAVEIGYRTETEDFGYRGDGAGTTFALWRDGALVAEEKAVLGEGAARLALRAPGAPLGRVRRLDRGGLGGIGPERRVAGDRGAHTPARRLQHGLRGVGAR